MDRIAPNIVILIPAVACLAFTYGPHAEPTQPAANEKRTDTPLLKALYASEPDLAEIRRLAAEKGQLNAPGGSGRTPLHVAAARHAREVVAILVEHGADVTAQEGFGFTPLHELLQWRSKENPDDTLAVLDFLLEKGADVNRRSPYQRQAALHILCSRSYEDLPWAEAVLERLIKKLADVNAYADFFYTYDEMTPLHLACMHGCIGVVQRLLEAGAKINLVTNPAARNHSSYHGTRTSLHLALSNRNAKAGVETTALLIEHGADVKATDDEGNTPLHAARTRKQVELLVSKGADVHTGNKEGTVPQGHDLGSVECLLEKGARLDAKDTKGRTRLHFSRDQEVVAFLRAKGLDMNATDNEGNTPLFHAPTAEVMAALLARGDDGSAGADPNVKNKSGAAPIHRPLSPEILGVLLDHGADANLARGDGMTPLHILAANGETEKVKVLLTHNPDATLKNQTGKTALAYAQEYKRDEIVRLIEAFLWSNE